MNLDNSQHNTILIDNHLNLSIETLQLAANSHSFRHSLRQAADLMVKSLRGGGKVILAGNGGSAADAQHIAGEFVARLNFDRAPLAAIALTVDTSVLTAVGNDYGYDQIFERQVRALGRSEDVFVGISTSGRSPNIIRALQAASELGMCTIGFGGDGETLLSSACNLMISAPTRSTPLIQQIHITAAHIICGLVELEMFGRSK